MALFARRRTHLPPDVAERLGVRAGDALAVAELDDGWAVATERGIVVDRAGEVLRRAWTDVDGARTTDDPPVLHLTWVDGTAPTDLPLAEARYEGLPQIVHERVQSSVVHSELVDVPNGGVVRVVLRRDADGELFTQVIGPATVDLDDPATAHAVDAAELRVREAAGL